MTDPAVKEHQPTGATQQDHAGEGDHQAHAGGGEGHGAHPSELVYIKVAIALAVVTAVEVGLYYTKLSQNLTNTVLITLALIKGVAVAAYFMHLKFDSKVLRRFFIGGFVLAMFCFLAYLQTLHVFFGHKGG